MLWCYKAALIAVLFLNCCVLAWIWINLRTREDSISHAVSIEKIVIQMAIRRHNSGEILTLAENAVATGEQQKVEQTTLDFDEVVKCRLDFQSDFNSLHPELFHPNIPIPASLFTKNGSVYAVLIAKTVNATTNEISRLPNQISWRGMDSWQLKLDAKTIINCSDAAYPKLDTHFWTFIVECPLEGIEIEKSVKQVNLLSVKHPEFNTAGRDLRVCDFELPPNSKMYQLVACTQTAENHLDRIPEWIEYHRLIGFQHFVIYVNEETIAKFQYFLNVYIAKLHIVTLVPFYFNVSADTGIFSQQAQQNDCIYRLKGRTEWLALHDVDEFFQLKRSNGSFSDFLNSFNKTHVGGISFENEFFGFAGEAARTMNGSLFSRITNMVQRVEGAGLEAAFSRSKMIVRPDNVNYFSVHQISNGGKSVHVDKIADARLVHYRWPYHKEFERALAASGSSALVTDKTLAQPFGETITRRLKEKGFMKR